MAAGRRLVSFTLTALLVVGATAVSLGASGDGSCVVRLHDCEPALRIVPCCCAIDADGSPAQTESRVQLTLSVAATDAVPPVSLAVPSEPARRTAYAPSPPRPAPDLLTLYSTLLI